MGCTSAFVLSAICTFVVLGTRGEADEDAASSADLNWGGNATDFVVVSERPRVFYFPHFLDEGTIERILAVVENK